MNDGIHCKSSPEYQSRKQPTPTPVVLAGVVLAGVGVNVSLTLIPEQQE